MKKKKSKTIGGYSGDLTLTPMYRMMMQPLVDKHREELIEMGYNPDKDWALCEWLVHHWEKDD